MKDLHLNIKKKYFDEIKNGIKTEEYRKVCPFWNKRLKDKKFDRVLIKLGYPKNNDKDRILCFKFTGIKNKVLIHEEFGFIPTEVYAIDLSIKEEYGE